MRTITTRRLRTRFLAPIAILFTVVGLVLTSGPAQAANYVSHTERWASHNDNGGIDTISYLDKVSEGYSEDYWINFHSYGEELYYDVDYRMNSRGVIDVRVYDDGELKDVDRFVIDIGSIGSLNLGTPDHSGNIPDGYEVRTRICVGTSTTCTPWVTGRA